MSATLLSPRASACLLLVLASASASASASAQIAHRLEVALDVRAGRIEVVDTVTLPERVDAAHFVLHAGLAPRVLDAGARLRVIEREAGPAGVPVEHYVVDLPPGADTFTVRYGGELSHPVASTGESYARSFRATPGLVSAEGVYLAGRSHWYPVFQGVLVTFELTVSMPAGWRSMSQGRGALQESPGAATERWEIGAPQEGIYLIAGPLTAYRQPAGSAEAVVLLRTPDPDLAARYLGATALYLDLYRRLLGAYPYAKFALVENFWETGYGMPSFTLLGPRVIRLPFILHSSFPHEILHNWWGNGVYVDYAAGNWSEGLTSYLADHLIKEQRAQGTAYRRETLQGYADHVRAAKDFPLRAFRGRHGAVSQAVGYGKTLMVFHMLRRRLGDERFVQGLRRLYERHRFSVASFGDIEASFAAVAGEPLDDFFRQWVERTGAPALELRDPVVERDGDGYLLRLAIAQTQGPEPYRLRVPLVVHLEGEAHADERDVVLDGRETHLRLRFASRPTALDVDPQFDVFRRLHRAEIPPAISQAFGADRALFVLPASAPAPLRSAYGRLVESWRRGRTGEWEVTTDADLPALPDDRSVWLLGWENRFLSDAAGALAGYDITVEDDQVEVGGERLARTGDVVVAVARQPGRPEHALVWVALDNVDAMAGLARKLPHYGKYGFLGFRGDEPVNVAKGQWPVQDSPMSVVLDGEGARGALAARAALIEPPAAPGRHGTAHR